MKLVTDVVYVQIVKMLQKILYIGLVIKVVDAQQLLRLYQINYKEQPLERYIFKNISLN